MHFFCLQNELNKAIQLVQKAVTGKVTSSAYQRIYIETTEDNKVKLLATNQTHTIITTISADIKEPGVVLLPLSLTRDVISKMPDVMVELKTNESNLLTVQYTQLKYSIQGFNVKEYEFIEDIPYSTSFDIPSDKLNEYIKATDFTVSIDETKPSMTGLLFSCENGNLDVVSSDSYRLSLVKDKLDESLNFNFIVPAKIFAEVMHLSTEGSLTNIAFNQRQIMFTTGNVRLITGLISGKFINYNAIIPKDYKTKITVEKKDFISVLERAYILADSSTMHPVKFQIGFNNILITASSEYGDAYEELNVMSTGDSLLIAFNSRFFIDMMKNIEGDVLEMEFTTNTRSCLIRSTDKTDRLYLILPIRI